MSIIQKKNCGLCRVELTPDDFYTFVSIPLYGQIHDVHIKCIDEFPAVKDQMQIFDQETFKQLEKEKIILQQKAEGYQIEAQQFYNENIKLAQKNQETQETVENFRRFNQFIVDHYKIIGVIENPQKQHGILNFIQIKADETKRKIAPQIILDNEHFSWNSSYLIHSVEVKNQISEEWLSPSFNFGFINRETNQIRFILQYHNQKKRIYGLPELANYTKINFNPQSFVWFNSAKYFPVIEVLTKVENLAFDIKIACEEFLDLSAFRSENPDLFTPAKKRFSSLKHVFRLKRDKLKK